MPPIGWAIFTSSSAGSIARPTAGWPSCASTPIPISRRRSLSVKAALALHQAHRRSEFEQFEAELRDRYNDEKVTLGGQTAAAPALLERLLKDEGSAELRQCARHRPRSSEPAPGARRHGRAGLAVAVRRLGRSRHDAAGAHPVGIERSVGDGAGRRRRRIDALRQLPRPSFRHRLEERQDALAVGGVSSPRSSCHAERRPVHRYQPVRDRGRRRIRLGPGARHEGRELPGALQFACRRADNGEVVWKSTDLPDYAALDLVGLPLLADGKLFIAAKTRAIPSRARAGMQQFVLAIQPHDGKVLWKTEVGTFRQGKRIPYWGNA